MVSGSARHRPLVVPAAAAFSLLFGWAAANSNPEELGGKWPITELTEVIFETLAAGRITAMFPDSGRKMKMD